MSDLTRSSIHSDALTRASDDQSLADLWVRSKRKSENTRAAYRRDAARLLAYGVQLRRLTLDDLLSFADALVAEGLAVGTQKRILSAVKSLLSFGQKTGYLQYNVGAALEISKVKNTLAERISNEEGVLKMIALESNPRRQLILRLLYATGGRVSELCGLCWRDAVPSGDAGQLTLFGKGEETRTVLLSPDTWRALWASRPTTANRDQPIFATRTGRPCDRHYILRIVKAAATRAGLPPDFSPHWLRHAHASHALDRGAPISLVRETLGHASVETTGRYLHARPSDSSARYLPI